METYPERSQVFERNAKGHHLHQSGGVPIQKDPHFTNQKGSSFANPEGFQFTDPNDSLFFVRRLPTRSGDNPNWCQTGKIFFVNPEESSFHQSGRVFFCQSKRVPILPIRNVPLCRTGRLSLLPIRKGTKQENSFFVNPEGSRVCRSGLVPLLTIRKSPNFTDPERGPTFANPERSQMWQSGRLPNRVGSFVMLEGYHLCQSGGVTNRKGPNFVDPKGSFFAIWGVIRNIIIGQILLEACATSECSQ